MPRCRDNDESIFGSCRVDMNRSTLGRNDADADVEVEVDDEASESKKAFDFSSAFEASMASKMSWKKENATFDSSNKFCQRGSRLLGKTSKER